MIYTNVALRARQQFKQIELLDTAIISIRRHRLFTTIESLYSSNNSHVLQRKIAGGLRKVMVSLDTCHDVAINHILV